MKSAEIRRQFIEFFRERGHTFAPSAPVVPFDDPTLMFTNAGMNQFKDVFLGHGTRPYARAANTQKCIRVSGKHNDLEEVGRDTYHHTFFEMLGNWSFGDYFKKEAIAWAWELLTGVWGLPKDRLYATVFGGDEHDGLEPDHEAEQLWAEVIGPERVQRFGKKDNFWEMGEVGPCGPCSEIHIDLTPDKSGAQKVNAGVPEVMEIWNLVFIQFNREPGGRLVGLPAKHVDTGMGFERLCRILQKVPGNYDTDLFMPIIGEMGRITGKRYTARLDSHTDTAFRVVADHLRMLTFAITDGALPSNEGRGYVLRRLVRRAARFGRQALEQREPFMYRLVPTLVEVMGEAFPELRKSAERAGEIIREEEASFGRTLDRGMALFEDAAAGAASKTIGAADAFKLYDTYGFPFDLTRQMAEERGLSVDEAGFEKLMGEAREKARAAARSHAQISFDGTLPKTDEKPKYAGRECEGTLIGWVSGNKLVTSGRLEASSGEVGLVLDRTCFYGEQGGQVGDAGTIVTPTGTFDVDDTQRLGDGIVHVGHVGDGYLEAGQAAQLSVDAAREDTRRNHTATHLLHLALREVLGEHVTQRGSLVDAAKLRFDFDHPRPVTAEEIERIERMVNGQILADLAVETRELPTEEARKLPGVRAFFGEKYGERVRVVEIGGGVSREFCGGTHLSRTSQAGLFKIVAEEGVAKGVRRITALTGPRAVDYVLDLNRWVSAAAGELNAPREELAARIAALKEESKRLSKQLRSGAVADVKSARERLLSEATAVGGAKVILGEVPEAPAEQLREAIDWFRAQAGSAAVLIGFRGEGKVQLLASMSDDLVKRGLKAGDLIKAVAPLVEGRGGGKPELAQAGGSRPEGLGEALAAGREWVLARLGN